MLLYYFGLAWRSLGRNLILTSLMIVAIGVGIGASMTVITVFRAMAADPIPEKSRQLFVPQIDSWGPGDKRHSSSAHYDGLLDQLSYLDAMALLRAHAAKRQTPMYRTGLTWMPTNPDLQAFTFDARATYSDFFPMFAVPFKYGRPWGTAEDEAHAAVVVLSRALNDKVFGGADSIGKTLNLDGEDYRVVGVLNDWRPAPRYYDVNSNRYGETEQAFIPFTHAVDRRTPIWSNVNCNQAIASVEAFLRSECVWLQFWVELPTEADAQRYRTFLNNYAAEQRRIGRFHWLAHTQLRNVLQWLAYQHVVADEVRIMMIVACGFFLVCLVNAMGLLLAKIMGRAADIATRRALGADRQAIFAQYLMEAGVIGLAGGLLGLLLTQLGLWGARQLLSNEVLQLAHLDMANVGIAVLMAVGATLLAGLYPTWRAAQVQPISHLKAA